jgi:S-adenosylmethionine:tRNA ribosyltransferase-isomerase
MSTSFSFTLPEELLAKEPPERRGISRDGVRLMVIDRLTQEVQHTHFGRISQFLRAGDLIVFNTSRTLPASLDGREPPAGPRVEVRLAGRLADDSWLVLPLCKEDDPSCDLRSGMKIDFGQGLTGTLYGRDENISKLWNIRFSKSGTELIDFLYRLGRPIRYWYVPERWNLDYYQNVYAKEPGSAEMPSAGRAFTWRLIFDLRRRGVETAYVTLHTGLSSYMEDDLDRGHPVSEEEYSISEKAARKVNLTHRRGGRVIAVGTTVVRALESVADSAGQVQPAGGYTRLRITADYKLRVADGLLTGLHEPEASHLDLLASFLPAEKIREAYGEAIERGYLWHEFGDLNLIL